MRTSTGGGLPLAVLILSVVAFSLITVALQVRALGMPYIDSGAQLERHRAVMSGNGIDPWQFRLLSELVAEGFLRLVRLLGSPHPVATGFIVFRVLQNLIIFSLVVSYLRTYGLDDVLVLLGLSCLAWGMTHALYNSDLQFNTYSDVAFYLCAALLVIRGRILWIPIVCGLAALNRETSLLIPLLVFGQDPARGAGRKVQGNPTIVAGIGILIGTAVVCGLRLAYGARPPGGGSPTLGLAMLRYNLFRYQSWTFLFATLGPVPILALVGRAEWPRRLRVWFWILVPIWCVVHFFAAVVAETRLFLVPQALIFIPGALLAVRRASRVYYGDPGIGGTSSSPSTSGWTSAGNDG